jgi:hypothetical protein
VSLAAAEPSLRQSRMLVRGCARMRRAWRLYSVLHGQPAGHVAGRFFSRDGVVRVQCLPAGHRGPVSWLRFRAQPVRRRSRGSCAGPRVPPVGQVVLGLRGSGLGGHAVDGQGQAVRLWAGRPGGDPPGDSPPQRCGRRSGPRRCARRMRRCTSSGVRPRTRAVVSIDPQIAASRAVSAAATCTVPATWRSA